MGGGGWGGVGSVVEINTDKITGPWLTWAGNAAGVEQNRNVYTFSSNPPRWNFVGEDWRIILKWILRKQEYESVNWMHKRPTISFLKDGKYYSGSIKSAGTALGTGNWLRNQSVQLCQIITEDMHRCLLWRQWRRNRPFISIRYSLRNGQHLFIFADKHSEMQTLSLSFRSPSRNKRVTNLCLTESITALAADIPHRSFMRTFRCCGCGFHCGSRPNALTDNRPTRVVQSVADISYCAEVTYLTGTPNKSLSNRRQKKKASIHTLTSFRT